MPPFEPRFDERTFDMADNSSELNGKLTELPVVNTEEEEEEFEDVDETDEGLTYIAYGERGEEVAFELSEDIEEALELLSSMKEDGFAVRLFQATELEVVVEE